MATVTVNLTIEAYARLKKVKGPKDSFSDVLREVPETLATCGEIEDYFKAHGVPKANRRLRAAMLAGRGRR
jgi:predicted CopG family antitoxin